MKKTIICMLKTNVHDHFFYKIQIEELKKLAKSLEYEVIREIIQTRLKGKSKFLLGSGKILEIKRIIQELNIETVIFYNNLTSKQKLNLLKALSNDYEIEILDRYELTLKIFEKNATGRLSKIQIQLARLSQNFPLFKLQANIKFKRDLMPRVFGPGEYAFHSKIKSYDKKMATLRNEIESLKLKKLERIQKRKKILNGGKICCIVGYYNAGKTTLFNLLTGADKPISEQPFTTLSSKYKRINKKINLMLVDTIGFVIDLDPRLIKSFELNLIDMKKADIIAYLVGLDDNIDLIIHKLFYGLKLLKEIEINPKNIIIIFNKVDLVSKQNLDLLLHDLNPILSKYRYFCISAKNRNSINGLLSYFENN
ncbi:MAG: GTPase [Candidatus Helarchaeota archaeon]